MIWDDSWNAVDYDELQRTVSDAIALRSKHGDQVIYSLENPNLNEVAVEGRVKFVSGNNMIWTHGNPYESEVVENPTWLDVAVLANDMVGITGDRHHIFLEAIFPRHKFSIDGKSFIKIYEFSMGS